MKKILCSAGAVFLTLSSILNAQTPVVVELFTSQGCSSCPPADEIMHDLAQRDDVIALALHVDYWDYIGWKDAFAHPRNADRQRQYAITGKRRSIYTPQMIVQGQSDIVGGKPMALANAIALHAAQEFPIDISLVAHEDQLIVQAQRKGFSEQVDLILVQYAKRKTVDIKRGENAGKALSYSNVVEVWEKLGDWSEADDFKKQITFDPSRPVVLIAQQVKAGPILGVAQLDAQQ